MVKMIRNTNTDTTVADVTVAMILGRPVTVDYERADGSRTVRKVEPFVVMGPDQGVKHPYFRAMDRRTREYRTFRFDRVYAYRVSNASGRYRVPRPDTAPAPADPLAGAFMFEDAWAAWLEATYDPDTTLADRLEDLEV